MITTTLKWKGPRRAVRNTSKLWSVSLSTLFKATDQKKCKMSAVSHVMLWHEVLQAASRLMCSADLVATFSTSQSPVSPWMCVVLPLTTITPNLKLKLN
jgi:hypothetical protein